MHSRTPDRTPPGTFLDARTRPGNPPSRSRPHRRLRRRTRAATLLGPALLTGLGLVLTACGGGHSHPAAGAPLTASPGQSLPGLPGASGTAHPPGSPPMPGMAMPSARSSAPIAPTGTAPAGAPATGTAVAIKNFAFAPAALRVKTGTTVTWTNQDSDAHTVTSTGTGGPLKSDALQTGGTYRYTFTKPGTYAYLCTIHPFMTATVTVTT